MKKLLICLALLSFLLVSCGKSLEKKADEFLAKGDKRNAYLFYQKAIIGAKEPPSAELKNKYLKITLDRAKQRLIDDESLESIPLFNEEFVKYADKTTTKSNIAHYIAFALEWADSIYIKFDNISQAVQVLDSAKKFGYEESINKRIDKYKRNFGKNALASAREAYKSTKGDEDPMLMLEAEYWALCADKYLKGSKAAKAILRKTRKANLSTYPAYDRAMEDGITDPAIDKYSIYMAITDKKKKRNTFTIEGTMYNLSFNPIDLNKKSFKLVDKKGKAYGLSKSSKFDKITLDVKNECKFTMVFKGRNIRPQKLVFKDGEHEGVKWWP